MGLDVDSWAALMDNIRLKGGEGSLKDNPYTNALGGFGVGGALEEWVNPITLFSKRNPLLSLVSGKGNLAGSYEPQGGSEETLNRMTATAGALYGGYAAGAALGGGGYATEAGAGAGAMESGTGAAGGVASSEAGGGAAAGGMGGLTLAEGGYVGGEAALPLAESGYTGVSAGSAQGAGGALPWLKFGVRNTRRALQIMRAINRLRGGGNNG